MSYGDTEFGGNWNLKGNVSVQEVRVVQRIQRPLVNCLETEINNTIHVGDFITCS